MTPVSRTANCEIGIMFLASTVGLAVLFGSSGVSFALPKDPIYNECACACVLPGESFGVIDDVTNTAGVPCGAYNNKTCNVEDPQTGGIRTGTLKYCGGFKPGGVKGMIAPSIGQNAPVLRRGIEGDQPGQSASEQGSPPSGGEVQERAIPLQRFGVSEANCHCDGGTGTCTTTISPDRKTTTCSKGSGTCTGTCTFPPPGTITGFGSGTMRQ